MLCVGARLHGGKSKRYDLSTLQPAQKIPRLTGGEAILL